MPKKQAYQLNKQGECIKLESNKSYKRVLLKLSGEVLAGEKKTGIDAKLVLASHKRTRGSIKWAKEIISTPKSLQ